MNTPTNPVAASSSFIPVETQIWDNGRHAVRCVKTIQETRDTKTFCFMAHQPLMFFFKPGQFVTLELEIDGEQVFRSYTISSSPSVPYSFSITVKRVPGGVVSNWIHDNLEEGYELAVHGPVGAFNSIDFPAEKVLLLSGGVGITPMMSMARWIYDTNTDVDISFVHSSRTPSDVIFHSELEFMSSRIANFHLHIICARLESGQKWAGYRGYLDETKLLMTTPDIKEREIFCCGPTPYMLSVKSMLARLGFNMEHYHEEVFGATPDHVEEKAVQSAEIAAEEADALTASDLIDVMFLNSDKQAQIAPGETVHAAAAKAGLTIPKACGMGICGTCKVKKVSGNVVMNHNGGITDEDVDDGYILSCCSVPEDNVAIEY
ncbi:MULTISPECIES: hybrid-cluster NAD(P)-dependent oxidoreductase [Vibrio]|uniref:2Fe-2S iron-sulfur cluster binding domain-containing protein n=2 Tax=Vibrio TaxID=662 RepID=A0A7X4LMX5_9VIBR|nr:MULTISPECIES: hybrid-cluster NAD(P)-dependent oxidoreductase [Vibrio]MBF9000953.1 hybrid-cluster NAD(P)-dependent oxidoreductase [Vibrio nitrifigilis]MZI94456.1 2Fe-2S iron-sulfur cluster binding domain-containing protein [Vibrio eleionomae]